MAGVDASAFWSELVDRVARRGAHPALADEIGARIDAASLADAVRDRARTIAGGGRRRRVVLAGSAPGDALVEIIATGLAGAVPAPLRGSMPEADRAERIAPLTAALPHRDETLVLSTSGTTGAAKLVALPGASLRLNVEAIGAALGLREDDRVLVSTSIAHAYGLVGGALTALWRGAEVHLLAAEGAGAALPVAMRRIEEAAITVVQGPATWHRLLDAWATEGRAFPTVRVVTMASEPAPPEMAEVIARRYPDAVGQVAYGMTEAGPRVCHLDIRDPRFARGGVGVPFPHVESRLLAERDGDGVIGADKTARGRLALRGPGMLIGYVARDGAVVCPRDAEGWVVTGDRVGIDAGDGCVVVGGRREGVVGSTTVASVA